MESNIERSLESAGGKAPRQSTGGKAPRQSTGGKAPRKQATPQQKGRKTPDSGSLRYVPKEREIREARAAGYLYEDDPEKERKNCFRPGHLVLNVNNNEDICLFTNVDAQILYFLFTLMDSVQPNLHYKHDCCSTSRNRVP